MSRYPTVLLFRDDKYAGLVDAYVAARQDKWLCTVRVVSTNLPREELGAALHQLWDPANALLVTVGDTEAEYHPLLHVPSRIARRWIHYSTSRFTDPENFAEINRGLNYCFVDNAVALDRQTTRPVFSAFTTCYNSYHKIKRAYQSLQRQTLVDWEWVVLDDSPRDVAVEAVSDGDGGAVDLLKGRDVTDLVVVRDRIYTASGAPHFDFLRSLFAGDKRVRLYSRSQNSGSIGNVKNEAAALCRGKYVVELDHDDELTPTALAEMAAVYESDPEVGFVYTDFANVHEDGRNFRYADFFGHGNCSYYCQRWHNHATNQDQWVNVHLSAQINNNTLTHLISLPNHARSWRRATLDRLGGFSEFLPICDDQELLMRTAVNTKMAKLNMLGYIQYMNDGGNNFSYLRNQEINRIGPNALRQQFFEKHQVGRHVQEKGGFEDPYYRWSEWTQVWKRDPTSFAPACINRSVAEKGVRIQTAVFGLAAFAERLPELLERVWSPTSDRGKPDVIVLDWTMEPTALCSFCEGVFGGPDRVPAGFKCYSFKGATLDEMVRFFFWMYKSQDTEAELIWPVLGSASVPGSASALGQEGVPASRLALIRDSAAPRPFTSAFSTRAEAINRLITPAHRYVEIGVEYGGTFRAVCARRKIAVDPDPKFEIDAATMPGARMAKMTSDQFFEEGIGEDEGVDAVFVDGMHQSEYILRDVQNATAALFRASVRGPTDDTQEAERKEAECKEAERKEAERKEAESEEVSKWLFLDDMLPRTSAEQQKVPGKHCFENGILKYREPWTGDGWKVLYHMLRSERRIADSVERIHVFAHPSYRGVVALNMVAPFAFDPADVDQIEAYDYDRDFVAYREALVGACSPVR